MSVGAIGLLREKVPLSVGYCFSPDRFSAVAVNEIVGCKSCSIVPIH